jgi:hypothetical protein
LPPGVVDALSAGVGPGGVIVARKLAEDEGP